MDFGSESELPLPRRSWQAEPQQENAMPIFQLIYAQLLPVVWWNQHACWKQFHSMNQMRKTRQNIAQCPSGVCWAMTSQDTSNIGNIGQFSFVEGGSIVQCLTHLQQGCEISTHFHVVAKKSTTKKHGLHKEVTVIQDLQHHAGIPPPSAVLRGLLFDFLEDIYIYIYTHTYIYIYIQCEHSWRMLKIAISLPSLDCRRQGLVSPLSMRGIQSLE